MFFLLSLKPGETVKQIQLIAIIQIFQNLGKLLLLIVTYASTTVLNSSEEIRDGGEGYKGEIHLFTYGRVTKLWSLKIGFQTSN